MVAPNELRIGNWVFRKTTGKYHQVKEVLSTRVLIEHLYMEELFGYMAVSVKSIDPIPLSPDILERAGFEKYEYQPNDGIGDIIELWQLGPVSFHFDNWGALIINNYHVNINRPKYLHQLQNLYFALTNEELSIAL